FRGRPVFGVGPRTTHREDDGFSAEERKALAYDNELLAHNSYLQAFADLGLLGGFCFVGACLLAMATLIRFRRYEAAIVDPGQRQLLPYLFGALTAYLMGMMSLSICYLTPTYFILAAPVAFARTTVTEPPLPPLRLDRVAVRNVLVAGIGVLVLVYLCVKFLRG
ncbi:MAG: hypothetical protein NZO58_12025, partial [Gemmataceae bacterium]|nr:hypothetical protein [Gemmataceae bacterium]